MEIKVAMSRTVDDIKKASNLHYSKYSPSSKYVSIMLLIGGATILFSEGQGHDPFDKALIAFFMITIGVITLWSRYNAGNRTARLCPNLLTEDSVTISEFKLNFDSKYAQTMLTWDIFVDAIISDDMILLYYNKIQFIILPKRFFSEEQYTFLKEKAATYIRPTTTRFRKM